MDLVLAQQIVLELLNKGKVTQIQKNNEGLINQTFVIWVEDKNVKKYTRSVASILLATVPQDQTASDVYCIVGLHSACGKGTKEIQQRSGQ